MVTETGSTNLFIEMVMFRKGNINITLKSDIQDHYYAVSYFHTFNWKKCLFLKNSQKKVWTFHALIASYSLVSFNMLRWIHGEIIIW